MNIRWTAFGNIMLLATSAVANAQTIALQPMVVTGTRAPVPEGENVFATRAISQEHLASSPGITLDEALRQFPAFSLFRRSDSLIAHPTTQGVSLRGLGPSGASRSLVLLDGVPLNDPFGGWVQWGKLPRESIGRVEIVPGGGGTAWGNASLGGVIQLFSRDAHAPGGQASVTIGDFDTRSVQWSANQAVGPGVLQISGQIFTSDGYHIVAPESLGSIDAPAGSRHQTVSGSWLQLIAPDTTAELTVRYFNETRGNGTPYQANSSEEEFASLRVVSKFSKDFAWDAVVYLQGNRFGSTYSAVNALRNAETPASDQYKVPASAAGGAITGTWTASDRSRTTFGADVRNVRGETREAMTYSAGQYTRNRVAGGSQSTAGVFAEHQREIAPHLNATAGLRVDYWRDSNGHRRESDLLTGASLRDDHFATNDGTEWSPSAGLVWSATENLKIRLSGQEAFRRPTLNELYRPFRVGNVITEANADLGTERVRTIESGIAFSRGNFSTSATVFYNQLRNAVGNVTVAHGPGNIPPFGFIPAGGLGRMRMNLDRIRVQGAEISLRWRATNELTFTLDGLANDAEVERASAAPNLEGLRVAQVPRFSGAVGVIWASHGWSIAPRGRWIGAQFEDDENQLRLAPAWVVDCTASRDLGRNAQLYLSVENLFNERIETGRSATGLINVGTPRFATGGVRVKW
ncbi:MAG TPA: TonB-dependent receptor [Opitutaceae bacterium]|nr:TonB-dependent receptor [Opitutaceae bacterium]